MRQRQPQPVRRRTVGAPAVGLEDPRPLGRRQGQAGRHGAKAHAAVGRPDLDRERPAGRDAAERPHAEVQHRRREQLAVAVERALLLGTDQREPLFGEHRVTPQLEGHLGRRLAEKHPRLARHELAGLEAVVVDHGPHRPLEPLEHPLGVGDALVEVAAPRVIERRSELGEVVDVRRQRGHLPRQIVEKVRQPVPALDDLRLLSPLAPLGAPVQRARPQQRPEAGAALLHVGRRREHRVGPHRQGPHPKAPQIVERADDHRHEVRAHVVLQAGAEIDGARGTHPIVDQHHVGRVQERLLEPGVGVVGGPYGQPLSPQETDQRARDRAIRRDDQPFGLARQRKLVAVGGPLVGEHLG